MQHVPYARLSPLVLVSVFAGLFWNDGAVRAGPVHGTLYYTVFTNQGLWKVDFTYNGTNSLTLTQNQLITRLPGADGLVFTADGQVAVGGQGNAVYKVNVNSHSINYGDHTSVSAGGTSAFHMMADNSGHIYSSGIPGTPAVYDGTVSANGTPLKYLKGADQFVDTITFVGNQAFYTSSGAGGTGDFGRISIDLTNDTFSTQRIYSNMNGFHGMTYDPYTGDLLTFGDNTINQIDPTTGMIVSRLFLQGGSTLDQGTVDGKGHAYIAYNSGYLVFVDYSKSKLIGQFSYFDAPFLNNSLDDVAPLVGPGSPAPEPSSVTLLLLGGLGLSGYGWRRHRSSLKTVA